MAITFTNLGASQGTANAPDVNVSTNTTSYATASWTPPTSGIIILFVINSRDTDLGSAPTVSGNSLTWTQIATIGIDSGVDTYRVTLFAADASGATTGATTVSFGADTQSGCILMFLQAEGVNISAGIASAFIQSPTNSGTGATIGTVTLNAAANSNNRQVSCYFHAANEGTARDAAWAEADDLRHGTPSMAGETQYLSSGFDTTSEASWTTSSDWIGIAAELKAIVDFTSTVTDTLGLTDTNSTVRELNRTLSDNLGLTDVISRVVDKVISISDNLGLTDLITASKGYIVTISDNLGLTDLITTLVTQAQNYVVTITDTLGLTDTVNNIFVHISKAALIGIRSLLENLLGQKNNEDGLTGGI